MSKSRENISKIAMIIFAQLPLKICQLYPANR